jgi:hypothetical protein
MGGINGVVGNLVNDAEFVWGQFAIPCQGQQVAVSMGLYLNERPDPLWAQFP